MTPTAPHRGTVSLLLGRLGGVAGSLVLGQVVIGVTYIVAARGIGPAVLGVIATCAAISTIGAMVFDAGLNDLLVREVAGKGLTVEQARAIVRGKRRLLVLLLVPALVAALAISGSVPMGLLLGFLGPAVWEAQVANGLLRAQGRFSRAASAQLTGRVTGLGLVLLLGVVGQPTVALPAALVAAFATEALIDRVFLGRARSPATSWRDARPHYRQGVGYGLASLAASAQQLDAPLVALGGGVTAAGLYAAAGRLLGPLGFLATALGLVAAPWLAEARGDRFQLRAEERRVLRIGACLCVAPLGAAALGPALIPLLLGGQYTTSGTVFAVLAIGSVFSTANQPLAIMVQNRGEQRRVALAVGVGLGLGLVTTFLLALAGDAALAAVGFLISQIYILCHLGLTVRRLRAADGKRVA